jgi:hypothetical protein
MMLMTTLTLTDDKCDEREKTRASFLSSWLDPRWWQCLCGVQTMTADPQQVIFGLVKRGPRCRTSSLAICHLRSGAGIALPHHRHRLPSSSFGKRRRNLHLLEDGCSFVSATEK